MNERIRVVVTGLGVVTPLGDDSWGALCRGERPRRLARIAVSDDRVVPGFRVPGLDDNDEPVVQVLDRALAELAETAGIGSPPLASDSGKERTAVLVGLSKGRTAGLRRLHREIIAGGPTSVPIADLSPSAGAERIIRTLGLRGPCLVPIAACATGLVAAIRGAAMIRQGACDRAIVGAADASLDPFLIGAFRRMGVLARCDDGAEPSRAIRPWHRERDGFLVGEGAGLLLLEREDQARDRGARIVAEFAGGAMGADAHHLTDLNPDPTNLARLIGRALDDAEIDGSEIDHVNVHGTATQLNDPLECAALRRAFGATAGHISCSANKAQIGHLLGAAGAVELAFTALAVRDQFAPPTRNLDRPDPACDLDGTPQVGRARAIRAALKMSIGFGGHTAVAVLRRYREG